MRELKDLTDVFYDCENDKKTSWCRDLKRRAFRLSKTDLFSNMAQILAGFFVGF